MLTLNIPKLSGQCGRLKCCLLYEDDMYTEAKKSFPKIGDKIHLPTGDYAVSSFNIMSRSIKLANEEDVQFITLDEYNKILHPNYRPQTFKKPLDKPFPQKKESGNGRRPEIRRNNNNNRRPNKGNSQKPNNQGNQQQAKNKNA